MWVSLLTSFGHQLFSHHHLPVLTVLLTSTRQRRLFVCLLAIAFLPITVCVCSLSLSISHGMHLVVPTHPYFFWVACHPNRTFSPKKPEQESQNRFFSSPHRQTIPSYLWPMTYHLLYWLGTGRWYLGLAHASSFSPATHAFAMIWRLVCAFYRALLASYGVGCFPICHSLWVASFGGWTLSNHGPSFPRPTLYSLHGLVSISCHITLLFLL